MNTTIALSPVQRADARAALALLAPLGLTLEQAARIALGKKNAVPACTIAEVASRFLRSKLGGDVRPATFDFYEERLNKVCDAFGDRQIDSLTRGEFKAWLDQTSGGPASHAATARAARALWRYALEQDPPLVNQVVTLGLNFAATANGSEGSKKFLPLKKAELLLKHIDPAYRSAIALMLFAGLRPEEVAGDGKERLRWEHVNTREKWIRVPGEIAKTGQSRVLENLPATVWRFLIPRQDTDPVAPVARRTLIEAGKIAADLATWPQDCLRHSFATYAVALTNNPGQVSLWLGHNGNPTMLHRHYRGLVSLAEAEKFFALRPVKA